MRRLVVTEPVDTLGPFRASSSNGRIYGPLFTDLVHFVSTKHRISQASARAVVNTIVNYIAGETILNNETFAIPRFGNIKRGKNAVSPDGAGITLNIRRSKLWRRYEDFEDPEDAGPRLDGIMPPGRGGTHEDDVGDE